MSLYDHNIKKSHYVSGIKSQDSTFSFGWGLAPHPRHSCVTGRPTWHAAIYIIFKLEILARDLKKIRHPCL